MALLAHQGFIDVLHARSVHLIYTPEQEELRGPEQEELRGPEQEELRGELREYFDHTVKPA